MFIITFHIIYRYPGGRGGGKVDTTKVLKSRLLILDFNEEIYRPHGSRSVLLESLDIKAK